YDVVGGSIVNVYARRFCPNVNVRPESTARRPRRGYHGRHVDTGTSFTSAVVTENSNPLIRSANSATRVPTRASSRPSYVSVRTTPESFVATCKPMLPL